MTCSSCRDGHHDDCSDYAMWDGHDVGDSALPMDSPYWCDCDHDGPASVVPWESPREPLTARPGKHRVPAHPDIYTHTNRGRPVPKWLRPHIGGPTTRAFMHARMTLEDARRQLDNAQHAGNVTAAALILHETARQLTAHDVFWTRPGCALGARHSVGFAADLAAARAAIAAFTERKAAA